MNCTSVRALVTGGWRIRWVGHEDGALSILMTSPSGTIRTSTLEIETIESGMPQILCGDADTEMLPTTVIPRNGEYGELRWAAVHGLNVGGNGSPGVTRPSLPDGCVCGYDIETDTSGTTGDAFPLPESRIVSLTCWCTCGYRLSITTEEVDSADTLAVASSSALVASFCAHIAGHRPMWLIGWNSYAFDNYCMLIHAPRASERHFLRTAVRTSFGTRPGYILNFPGTYNVDLYAYLDRTQRHRYPQLSLSAVSAALGGPPKTTMPDLRTCTVAQMLSYNMNDSMVTSLLWRLTGACHSIPSIACASCSPVYDCVRHITGSMSTCTVASECLSRGICYCWSAHPPVGRYKGGYVSVPDRGLHDNVAVCDFSSMYPNIMIGANVSPDSMSYSSAVVETDGTVDWSDTHTYVTCDATRVGFRKDPQGAIPKVTAKLVQERAANRRSHPPYAQALKEAANSVYGSLGYEHSSLYSPMCSKATTTIGRWCLSLSMGILEKCGMRIIYGDTDSCFASATSVTRRCYNGDIEAHCSAGLKILALVLTHTPFSSMDMRPEGVYKRVLLIEKKNYAYTTSRNVLMYKGIAAARKDTLGVCRKVSKCAVDLVLRGGNTRVTRRALSSLACLSLDACALGTLGLFDVSKVVRAEGGNCYRYPCSSGKDVDVKVEDADLTAHVLYDRSKVSHAISVELSRYTVAAGMGRLNDVMRCAQVFCID